jgi:hypothetical protein
MAILDLGRIASMIFFRPTTFVRLFFNRFFSVPPHTTPPEKNVNGSELSMLAQVI